MDHEGDFDMVSMSVSEFDWNQFAIGLLMIMFLVCCLVGVVMAIIDVIKTIVWMLFK